MSVVNKMLKDLEQRGNKSVYEADYVPIESQSTQSRKLAAGSIVIVLAISFTTWFLLPEKNSIVTAKIQAPQPKNLKIMPLNAGIEATSTRATFDAIELPSGSSEEVQISELDQATLNNLERAKQAEKDMSEARAIFSSAALSNVSVTKTDTANSSTSISSPSSSNPSLQKPKAANQSQNNVQQQQLILEKQVQAPAGAEQKTPVVERAVFNVSSSTKSTSSNRMLEQQIQLSLANGDTDEALKDLYNLISLEPRNASAIKRLASLEFAQGNPVKAGLILKQGVKLLPKDSSIRLMQARLLFRANKNQQALEVLNAHPLSVTPDDDLLSFRAALAEKQKDYVTSLADYSSLLQRQPSNARWMLGLAISQDKQKMHEEALISYKKVKSSNQLSAQVVSFIDGRLAALKGS